MTHDINALINLWVMFRNEHNDCSVDKMVCDPELRNELVRAARKATGIEDEKTILSSLMRLRKNSKLPRASS